MLLLNGGQYKSLIESAVLRNLFRLDKKPVASEKQQELLSCFSAEIAPANKAVVSDEPYQLNSDFLSEDHLIVKKKKKIRQNLQQFWC